MLDIKLIREYPDTVKQSVAHRNAHFDVDYLLDLDERRRAKIGEVDELRAQQNNLSRRVEQLHNQLAQNDIPHDTKIRLSGVWNGAVDEARKLKPKLGHIEFELKTLDEEFELLMHQIPNVLHPDVPVGKDESENKILKKWGKVRDFGSEGFEPKDHLALGERLGILNIEKAGEVSGTRFAYLMGPLVHLQFALVRFAFDVLTSSEKLAKIAKDIGLTNADIPFIPVSVPLMIRPEVYTKTARLSETTKEERYRLADDDLYLIGSGEHTLVPLHMNETIDKEKLPLRYVTFSTCFRREAGSYGKDTHGILRMHQFDKVEMESFTMADDAFLEHKFFIAIQEYLVQALKLPYQVVLSCSGDTDDPCVHHVDIECWMPGQQKYRETHSADYTTDYQTRRLNTKVRIGFGLSQVSEFAHTNDATVFAVGRTLIAILENYQEEDGSVRIPDVLQPFMGGMERISAKNNE